MDSRSAGLFTGRAFMLHRDCVVSVTNIRGKGGGVVVWLTVFLTVKRSC